MTRNDSTRHHPVGASLIAVAALSLALAVTGAGGACAGPSGRGGPSTGGAGGGGPTGIGGQPGTGGRSASGGAGPLGGASALAGRSGGGGLASGGGPVGGAQGTAGGGGWNNTGGAAGGSGRGTLDIYFIDVEGGAATLLVSPSGQTLLVDGGFPGSNDRDLNRILAVLNEQVRVTKLDYVITTHYHIDHVGGVAALASRFPVDQFLDHGPSVEMGRDYDDYLAAIAGKTRVIVRPGDRVPFGDVELVIVSSAGALIDPLPTAVANPHCEGAPLMAERPSDENAQSVGFIARFGTFDFVDLGDLTWAVEDRLACPTNRLGTVDLFQVSHHGLNQSSAPQLVHGLAPAVALMNNGASKGGSASTWDTLKSSPGLEDIWSLHRVTANDAAHNAIDALTANVTSSPDGAYLVRASVARDGSYTLVNSRTGEARTYRAR